MSESLETLIFLPGASGNTQLWRPVADGLSRPGSRRLLGWPGFGGLAPDPTICGIADLVKRVVEEMRGPAVLFAQSMGGVVALRATLAKPESVRGLVLSVTSGGIDLRALGAEDWRPRHRSEQPNVPNWFFDEREDLTAHLPQIRIPTLLLWGDADPISPVAVGKRLAQLLPRAELVVIAGGTHDLASERAADILPHIERFLAGLD